MEDLLATLASLDAALSEVVGGVFADDALRAASDDHLLEVVAAAAGLARHAEALLVEGAAQIDYRSAVPPREHRIAVQRGCRSANELLQRVTRSSARTASELLKAGRAISCEVAPSSGEVLPPDLPAMRGELAAGRVGLDGMLAVAWPLVGVATAAGRAALLAADEELAAAVRGEGADAAPPPCADELRALATVWAMYLDPDGAEPRERAAMRKRGVTLGVCRDGLVPIRGNLLPDVARQWQLVAASILNPKAEEVPAPTGPWFTEADADADADAGAGSDADAGAEAGAAGADATSADDPADRRTYAQRQHDAFAMMLAKVAGSGMLPTLGGAAPVLVVSVRAEDLENDRGYAHLDGCEEPVSLTVARQIACCGNVQRVISDVRGRIVSIETTDRVFAHHQRKALALRDGGCVIPGCRVDASWCEIHHVHEHARGGSTHTDNGVMLCWFHHRTLETSGWAIRMNRGIPEVRGPNWWDNTGMWRPATKSPVRMRERRVLRT